MVCRGCAHDQVEGVEVVPVPHYRRVEQVVEFRWLIVRLMVEGNHVDVVQPGFLPGPFPGFDVLDGDCR